MARVLKWLSFFRVAPSSQLTPAPRPLPPRLFCQRHVINSIKVHKNIRPDNKPGTPNGNVASKQANAGNDCASLASPMYPVPCVCIRPVAMMPIPNRSSFCRAVYISGWMAVSQRNSADRPVPRAFKVHLCQSRSLCARQCIKLYT